MDGLSKDRWRRIEAILDRALDLGDAERAAFVGELCDGDEALGTEVEALLAADRRGHPLLDTSLGELAGPLLRELAGTTSRIPPAELVAGTRLGSYEVLSRVGVGGMGEVYRARDLEVGREVAVKVLRSEAAADPERLRRFEREARSASALNHPSIVTIHGIGEERGTRYIVMEHVEGRTLRELLAAGPLPAKELFRLASQMASGLEKAHAAGIVHRDLKPENVMVSDRRLREDSRLRSHQADVAPPREPFPCVRHRDGRDPALPRDGGVHVARAGEGRDPGLPLGSVLAGGDPLRDGDGRRAFRRQTVAETLSALLESAPEPPLGSELPAGFRSLVERCLAKRRNERFDSTRDLAQELLDLHEHSFRSAGPSPAPAPSPSAVAEEGGAAIDSLAILPLVNLSGDPGEEYFADGMTEALIADLAGLGGLRVISRTSVMRFKGSDEPLPEIARKLGVEGIVEGSVLRAGNRVRITAQLVHAATDSHLWAQSYERDLGDVLALQGEVARAIAREIHLRAGARITSAVSR